MIEFFKDSGCVHLAGLPMPISSNNYIGKRYATKEKQQFVRAFSSWTMCNGKRAKQEILKFLFGDNLKKFRERKVIASIKVDYVWTTNFKTQEGKMKIIDASNRVKLAEDCLAEYLTINDCYFKDFWWESRHNESKEDFSIKVYRPNIF